MGIMDFVKGGVREMMIARPDGAKPLLVYKHPDQNVPMYSQLTVDGDECALFFKDGKYMGYLPTGRHTLQTQNIPFLNQLVTQFTGGNVFIAEIYFVTMKPIFGVTFGGPLESMEDPVLFEFVTPRIFGEFALRIVDPVRFVLGYYGQAAGSMDNDQTLNWIKGKFFMSVKAVIGGLCAQQQKSLLNLGGMTMEIQQAILAHAPNLAEIGVAHHRSRQLQHQLQRRGPGHPARGQQGPRRGAARRLHRQGRGLRQAGRDRPAVRQGRSLRAAARRQLEQLRGRLGDGRRRSGHGPGRRRGRRRDARRADGRRHGDGQRDGQPAPGPPVHPAAPAAAAARGPGHGAHGGRRQGLLPQVQRVGPRWQVLLRVWHHPGRGPRQKFCTGCGVEIGAAKFCANCGTPAPPLCDGGSAPDIPAPRRGLRPRIRSP